MVHPNYYDMVGLKSEAQELADTRAEIEHLRELLRQVYDGVTDEYTEWFKGDTYSDQEMTWLEATRRALG